MTTHPNSKKVTIYRTGSFLARAQGPEISEYFQSAKMPIGSYWEGQGSNKVGTGLSFPEQNILMPNIINCEADEKGFRAKVEEFFHEITSEVPYGTGLTLEIGLYEDNDKPVSSKNLPINIGHYVKYRHHIGHPDVAKNRKESDSDARKQYYVFDPLENQQTASQKVKERDASMQIYLKLKTEPEKVDMMLTMFNIDPREFTGPVAEDLKTQRLREISESEPVEFVKNYTQQDLDLKYIIKRMVVLEVLTQIGHSYRVASSKLILGHSLDETIAYFQNPEYEQEIALLKAAMQEAGKKPIAAGIKKTVLTPKQLGTSM